MAIKEYDVFVMGTGNAGKKVAYDCAAEGMKVAIADDREYGGTCANRGCDPKKVLVGVTEAWQSVQNLKGKGITAVPRIDWPSLHKFKATFTDAVPAVNEKGLKNAGIALYHQSARFLNENSLSVEGKTVKVKKVVIATGQRQEALKIPGREYFRISDDFLALESLPEQLIFVGAGYIGMEFAHVAARCGARVTIIQSGSRPLKNFDADIVGHLTAVSRSLGIEFVFNARVSRVEKLQKNYRVFYQKEGKEDAVTGQLVFNSAGRVPSIGNLDLEKGNVAFDKKGITVNEYLQNTTNPDVYACGDASASGLLPLTPTSVLESRIVSLNLRKGNTAKIGFPPVPSVVFTIPQVAKVGLSEEEAEAAGYDYQVKYESVPKWFNAKHRNEPAYAFKTIVDKKQKTILGAHLISSEAGEQINLFALAMAGGLTADDLKKTVFAYPTWGNDLQSMC